MRPELDDTLAAGSARTATAAGRPAPASTAAALAAGRQLGHFRIDRRLGVGGMGEVYLATDLALDRPVAIKVLPETTALDPSRRERMIREARAQARVTHPNVGHIYFIGEDDGRLYFAMEYVAGQTLAERLADGPVAIDAALDIVRSTALGLREAQRSGFTHRDVKPSNLMVDPHGVLKVLDFGLAAGAPEAAGDGPVAQTSLAGTPLYMAPEQARGEPVDFRADIYALGATLYHLVAGKPPFHADSVEELLTLHANAPRPAVARRGQPRTAIASIDALCARMMAPRVEDRFASYDELLRAIELASNAHTRPAGFWARGIAKLVDFMILVVVASAPLQIALHYLDRELDSMLILWPLFAIYLMLAIGRWGRTLGQALLELEVVDLATSGRPRWGQSAWRATLLLGLPALTHWTSSLLDDGLLREILGLAAVLWCTVNVIQLLYASVRTHGKRAWWDRVAGTMVRYRTIRTPAI